MECSKAAFSTVSQHMQGLEHPKFVGILNKSFIHCPAEYKAKPAIFGIKAQDE